MSAVASRNGSRVVRVARADLIAVAIPVALGALLCAVELNTRSLWLDEGATIAITSQHGAALWRGIVHDGGNMLLYYLLIHVVGAIFGHAAWVLRLPSLLADAATGGLVTALGLRLLGDRRQAVAGGLLTVVSLPLVFWGQDARGYALMVTFATASMLAFAVLVAPIPGGSTPSSPTLGEKGPATGPFSPRVAIAYVLTTLAALYVGYDAGLLILAQLALLPLFRERARIVLGSLVVVAVLSIPLAVLALERGSAQLFWVPPLGGSVLGQTTLTLLSAGLPPNFHYTATTVLTAVLTAVLLLAALVVAVRVVRRSADRRAHWRLWLLGAWLVIPIVVALLASAAGEPIELARCAILLIPPISLLLVWVLAQPRLPRLAALSVLVALLALRLAQVIPAYGSSPEDWKAAVAYVRTLDRNQPACVAFYPQDGRQVFDYYLGRGEPRLAARLTPVLPALAWDQVKPFVEQYGTLDAGQLAAIGPRCTSLFLLASHVGQSTGPPASRANLRRYHELQAALAKLYPEHAQRGFGWAAAVDVTRYAR